LTRMGVTRSGSTGGGRVTTPCDSKRSWH